MEKIVIYYQSLNSNCSNTHDVRSSSNQQFTRKTRKTNGEIYSDEGSGQLEYDTNNSLAPDVAIQSAPNLRTVKKRKNYDSFSPNPKRNHWDSEFKPAFQNKSLQNQQIAHREFNQGIDVCVYGEQDASHPEWGSSHKFVGINVETVPNKKTCNCFSAYFPIDSCGKVIKHGPGWIAVVYRNCTMVFIHVPNKDAKSRDAMELFYKNIINEVGDIDVIMGDTNQTTPSFTQKILKDNFTQVKTKQDTKVVKPVDMHSVTGKSHGGTNSTSTKMFDVAFRNKITTKSAEIAYTSQQSINSNTSNAFTDHMGIMLSIEK